MAWVGDIVWVIPPDDEEAKLCDLPSKMFEYMDDGCIEKHKSRACLVIEKFADGAVKILPMFGWAGRGITANKDALAHKNLYIPIRPTGTVSGQHCALNLAAKPKCKPEKWDSSNIFFGEVYNVRKSMLEPYYEDWCECRLDARSKWIIKRIALMPAHQRKAVVSVGRYTNIVSPARKPDAAVRYSTSSGPPDGISGPSRERREGVGSQGGKYLFGFVNTEFDVLLNVSMTPKEIIDILNASKLEMERQQITAKKPELTSKANHECSMSIQSLPNDAKSTIVATRKDVVQRDVEKAPVTDSDQCNSKKVANKNASTIIRRSIFDPTSSASRTDPIDVVTVAAGKLSVQSSQSTDMLLAPGAANKLQLLRSDAAAVQQKLEAMEAIRKDIDVLALGETMSKIDVKILRLKREREKIAVKIAEEEGKVKNNERKVAAMMKNMQDDPELQETCLREAKEKGHIN